MLIREDRPTLNFLDSYRAQYGVQEDVSIRRLELLMDPPETLRMELTSHRSDFRYFEFAPGPRPWYASRNNTLIIRLGGRENWQGQARAVYDRGKGETIAIEIAFSSAQRNAAAGDPLPSRYTVKMTPRLEMEVPSPEDWSRPLPTAADRRFAQERWGRLVKGVQGDYARACVLAKALCRELWPHNGTPEMPYDSPFGMYRKMMAGRSKGFCVQFNMIFVQACRCLGILARNLHIERPLSYGQEGWVFMAGMHCASEVFDRDSNRWIFMDIRFFCLGAWLGEEGPLSIGELHLFISQPHWRERLRFQIYDMEHNTESRLPMERCPRPDIDFYAGWNTVFHYGFE